MEQTISKLCPNEDEDDHHDRDIDKGINEYG